MKETFDKAGKEYNASLVKKYKPLAIILSIFIPVLVAFSMSMKIQGIDLSMLPPIYATTNGIVAVLLALAVMAIKNKNLARHQLLIKLAIFGSVFFLLAYVAHHITSDTTYFGDVNRDGKLSELEKNALGSSALVYYFILFTHIILSIVIIPLVLFTYLRGWSGNYAGHKKLAKYTFPLWLYVSVTGVIVYLMISPFYP